MSDILLRANKGSPLTNNEVDHNFEHLDTVKLEISNNLSDLASASTALTNLGITATSAELNYTAGVTSSIQTQIDALQRPSIAVTVADSGSGNKFYLDGTEQQIARLIPSVTYKFDQSDSSNSGHPLLLSTTADGTHGGGSSYTVGVTAVGTPGTAGAYTEVKLEQDAPDTLYYYCSNHSGMGGEVTVRAGSITLVDLGVTASASELNTLSGITASTSELNTLTGIPATLTATELGYVDGVTSSIQTQIDSLGSSAGTTLTKTFTAGESYTMTLSDNVLVPVVSVTKEVNQTGVTNNDWLVNSSSENYTRYNTATAVTLTPSAVGDGTFTLGSGSFTSADVGKRIEGNGGVAILTATNGSYTALTNFANTNAIASGSWAMYGLQFNATDGDLELSGNVVSDFTSATKLDDFDIGQSEGTPTGLTFSPDGTVMVVSGDTQNRLFQYTLSTGFDLTTASYANKSYDASSLDSAPRGVRFNNDGTKIIWIGESNRRVYAVPLTTAYDLSTASSYASFNISSSQTTDPTGLEFNPDGTIMYIVGRDNDECYQYTLSTGFDVTTASYANKKVDLSSGIGGLDPRGLFITADGTKLYHCGTAQWKVFEFEMSTPFDVSTASYTSNNKNINPDTTDLTGVFFTSDSIGKMYVIGQGNDYVVEYSVKTATYPTTGYHAAHTNLSTDSTYWTDINSMTASESAGSGNIYYCISTDDRTTWKVAKGTDGERSIVRNNSGTWQYNSNATYGSTTWANATVNAELYAIQEAMGTAANQMNKTQLDAVPDANHFTLANDLDLAIIMNQGSGATSLPSSDGVAINYDANVLNQGAILGTDYNYDAPAQDKVRITAVNGANLKVRVI